MLDNALKNKAFITISNSLLSEFDTGISLPDDANITDIQNLKDLHPELVPILEGIQSIINHTVDLISSMIEINNNAICQVDSQLHSDKIQEALDCRSRWEKKVRYSDAEGIRLLRNDVENYISRLISDMKERLFRIKKFSEEFDNKRLRLFGWIRVRSIRNDLEELKQSFFSYKDLVLLLIEIEFYFGEIENLKQTLNFSIGFLETFFPKDNCMFDLTDDHFWNDEPGTYIEKFQKLSKNAVALEKKDLLPY